MRNTNHSSIAAFEMLQPRTLLSVTTGLNAGTLIVTGTSGNDLLQIKIFPQTPTKLTVCTEHARIADFNLSEVTGVVMHGLAGNDRLTVDENDFAFAVPVTIFGGEGRDVVGGGSGDDLLSGDGGKDWVSGGAGNDTVFGGGSKDLLYGNAGDDLIIGGQGADRIYAGAGNDTVLGGAQRDQISGSDGNDYLYGGADRDEIRGQAGDDTVIGGRGNDVLDGGDGADLLQGGSGADHFAVDADDPEEGSDRTTNDVEYTPSANDDFVDVVKSALSSEFPDTNIESVDVDTVNEVMRIRYTYTTSDKPGTFNMLILNPGNEFENPDLIWYEIHPLAAQPEFLAAFSTLRPGATALSIIKCDMIQNGVHNGRGYKVAYQIADTGETGVLLCSDHGDEFPVGTAAAV